MKRSHLTRDIIELVAIILLLFVVMRFIIHGYHVQEANMHPSIENNSYVMVNRVAYLLHQPRRGDTIVFHYPLDVNQDVMARIIGLPGDKIKTDNKHVWVDGVVLNEPYVLVPSNPEGKEWVVPTNTYFVMNDNRQIGDDSRNWGPLKQDYIVGKAICVYWPSNQWRLINTYPGVFGQIK